MLEEDAVHVHFGGREVTVHSRAPEVIAAVRSNYRSMLGPGEVIAALKVEPAENLFHLTGTEAEWQRYGPLGTVLEWINELLVLQFVQSCPEFVWLHAGAVEVEGQALLLPGPSGRGKSTLVGCLCRLGHPFLADDVLAIEPETRLLHPFPVTPTAREDVGVALPPDRLRELRKFPLCYSSQHVCRTPLPLGAVVFPEFTRAQPVDLRPVSPATAAVELIYSCANLTARDSAAVKFLCSLVEQFPVNRLLFADPEAACHLLLTRLLPPRSESWTACGERLQVITG